MAKARVEFDPALKKVYDAIKDANPSALSALKDANETALSTLQATVNSCIDTLTSTDTWNDAVSSKIKASASTITSLIDKCKEPGGEILTMAEGDTSELQTSLDSYDETLEDLNSHIDEYNNLEANEPPKEETKTKTDSEGNTTTETKETDAHKQWKIRLEEEDAVIALKQEELDSYEATCESLISQLRGILSPIDSAASKAALSMKFSKTREWNPDPKEIDEKFNSNDYVVDGTETLDEEGHVISRTYTVYDKNGKIVQTGVIKYDADGKEVKRVCKDDYGKTPEEPEEAKVSTDVNKIKGQDGKEYTYEEQQNGSIVVKDSKGNIVEILSKDEFEKKYKNKEETKDKSSTDSSDKVVVRLTGGEEGIAEKQSDGKYVIRDSKGNIVEVLTEEEYNDKYIPKTPEEIKEAEEIYGLNENQQNIVDDIVQEMKDEDIYATSSEALEILENKLKEKGFSEKEIEEAKKKVIADEIRKEQVKRQQSEDDAIADAKQRQKDLETDGIKNRIEQEKAEKADEIRKEQADKQKSEDDAIADAKQRQKDLETDGIKNRIEQEKAEKADEIRKDRTERQSVEDAAIADAKEKQQEIENEAAAKRAEEREQKVAQEREAAQKERESAQQESFLDKLSSLKTGESMKVYDKDGTQYTVEKDMYGSNSIKNQEGNVVEALKGGYDTVTDYSDRKAPVIDVTNNRNGTYTFGNQTVKVNSVQDAYLKEADGNCVKINGKNYLITRVENGVTYMQEVSTVYDTYIYGTVGNEFAYIPGETNLRSQNAGLTSVPIKDYVDTTSSNQQTIQAAIDKQQIDGMKLTEKLKAKEELEKQQTQSESVGQSSIPIQTDTIQPAKIYTEDEYFDILASLNSGESIVVYDKNGNQCTAEKDMYGSYSIKNQEGNVIEALKGGYDTVTDYSINKP